MKLIKRAAPWGAIRIILIIFFITTTVVCVANTTTKEPKVPNPIKTEQVKENKSTKEAEEIEEVEEIEETEEEKTETPQAVVQDTPQSTKVPNTSTSNTTLTDREMLARLVYLEGNTESLECQKAIVSVVINRLNSGYWGNTINSVIYASGQFVTASRILYTTPTSTNYEAVDYVLTNGVTLPSYVLYFREGYHFSWNGYVPYTSIGSTYFGYMSKDKK